MIRLGRLFSGFLAWMIALFFSGIIVGLFVLVLMFKHYGSDLPDYSQLEHYDPATVTRLYAGDGRMMAEYATEKRIFVPLNAIPKRVTQAFLAAEDKNFYKHGGIDFQGLARALYTNVLNYGQGKSLVGGSTITQQVVKNFLLSNEKSLERKIKEAILAWRITQVYSKDKILELYLNEIYLGLGSYGVATAALNYFNKSLEELTIEEVALLAAQPKAPANYDPRRNAEHAKTRRDWVLHRMMEDGYITREEEEAAASLPFAVQTRAADDIARADFFAEEVRRQLAAMYGSNVLYEGGLVVKTTLDPKLQAMADRALRKALTDYDRRRGFRGPVARLGSLDNWKDKLAEQLKRADLFLIEHQQLGVVSAVDEKKAQLNFADGSKGTIPMSILGWTRRVLADGVLGPEVRKPGDILKTGDVVIVGPVNDEQKKKLPDAERKTAWDLQQIPAVNGAMVVMDPHTGRVLALSGGYAYGGTEFNRATQAKRQPGSSFKPFVYLAGLESNFRPNTMLLDAPVEMSQGAGLPNWKPQNYKDEYLGMIPLRVGLEKSRNTITVRLAQAIGIDRVLEVAERFSIYDKAPRNFSIVLGSAETTLLRLTNGYSMIVNGGHKVLPSLIERIDNRHGKIIFRRDARLCSRCRADGAELSETPPALPDTREQVVDPRIAYQMVSLMEGVVQRGTATRAKVLNRPLGGKTGTTNDSMDTWFIGFSPDLVVGTYVGFDKPQTLGKKETGGSVALPGFIAFMEQAMKDKPPEPFRIPKGIMLQRVDLATGEPVYGDGIGQRTVMEAFITGDPIWLPEPVKLARAAEPQPAAPNAPVPLPWLAEEQQGQGYAPPPEATIRVIPAPSVEPEELITPPPSRPIPGGAPRPLPWQMESTPSGNAPSQGTGGLY